MAQDLNITRLDSTAIPSGFSDVFRLYLLENNNQLGQVGGIAKTADGNASSALTGVNNLTDAVNILDGIIVDLLNDYISKTAAESQYVQGAGGSFVIGANSGGAEKLEVTGSANVTVSYKVGGVQVVGAKNTGWTAATGTGSKGAFNADTGYNAPTNYDQSAMREIADGLQEVRKSVKAIRDMLALHGLTNA